VVFIDISLAASVEVKSFISLILIFIFIGSPIPYLVDRPGKKILKSVVSSLNGEEDGTSLL